MTTPKHLEVREELLAQLLARSTALWGKARTEELRQQIEQTTDALIQISHSLPGREEEPAFFW
ncbi:MAG: hypothetical protein HYU30_06770 [Chloroflexi bacterium]|nr:hypothetical protein [Chloroflexota bacterium]